MSLDMEMEVVWGTLWNKLNVVWIENRFVRKDRMNEWFLPEESVQDLCGSLQLFFNSEMQNMGPLGN